jgi:ubiquinone/menaquinone biosynthesis C-methylase UbiE
VQKESNHTSARKLIGSLTSHDVNRNRITHHSRFAVTNNFIPEPTVMSAHQRRVDRYFKSAAKQWDEIYELDTVYARIHQERGRIVLSMSENVAVPVEARVLEIGCGAGLATVALAERGYAVEAVDTVRDMLLTTKARAARAAVAHRIKVIQASADHLPYADNQFNLVLAIGVLPWLACIRTAMMEFIRVIRPGGCLIVNIDNTWRLHELLDPRLHPVHSSVRHYLRKVLRLPAEAPPTQRCSPRKFDRLIDELRCTKIEAKLLGFGPFSFFGHPLFSESLNVKINGFLQNCADRRLPIIRFTAAQYITLLRKGGGSGQ